MRSARNPPQRLPKRGLSQTSRSRTLAAPAHSCYTVAKSGENIPKREESENMASPELEREREPGGIFIRYATVHDVDEVKSQLNRQDVRMDNQDAKIDTVIADMADIKSRQNVLDTIIVAVAEIKARQDAQEAKTDRHHAHMYRLLYTLLAAAVIALLMFAREAFF